MSRTAGEQLLFIIGPQSGNRLGPARKPADDGEAYGYGGRAPYPGLDMRPLPTSGKNERSNDGGRRERCDDG